jgi:hypothetical protein
VLLSLLDVPTDDAHWLTLDPPRRRWAHAALYSALKKAISADWNPFRGTPIPGSLNGMGAAARDGVRWHGGEPAEGFGTGCLVSPPLQRLSQAPAI